jgi:multisubunit Na+/H+ antiporter MnhB subunit
VEGAVIAGLALAIGGFALLVLCGWSYAFAKSEPTMLWRIAGKFEAIIYIGIALLMLLLGGIILLQPSGG